MTTHTGPVRSHPHAALAAHVAGAAVVVVATVNVLLGLISLTTDQIRLATPAAWGLVTIGVVLAAAGLLIWRGHRNVTILVFAVFAMLLLFQVSELATGAADTAPGTAEAPLTRFGVLAVLVALTGWSAWHRRRRDGRG